MQDLAIHPFLTHPVDSDPSAFILSYFISLELYHIQVTFI